MSAELLEALKELREAVMMSALPFRLNGQVMDAIRKADAVIAKAGE